MPSSTYLPRREADLISFSTNFNTKINIDPLPYGLSVQQATDYTVLHDAFVAAWNMLQDPATRTQPNTVTKNDEKAALIGGPGGIRQLVGIVQQNPATADAQRSDLRLTIRDTEPTPVPPPADSPVLTIVSTIGRVVSIRLQDLSDLNSRAKPDGVYAANVLSYVGEEPPTDLADWKIEGTFTRTMGAVTFPASVPAGSTVWITGYWLNTKGESGPAAPMQTTNVAGGLPQAA